MTDYSIWASIYYLCSIKITKGKEFILDSIEKQIIERRNLFKHADEGEKLVKSNILYDLSPFYILPLRHWRFHNEAEIKWLEYFKEMLKILKILKNSIIKL